MGVRKIYWNICTGCGICVDHCPLDVLRLDYTIKKAFIKYPRDCQACFLCQRDCPEEGAIYITAERERKIVFPW